MGGGGWGAARGRHACDGGAGRTRRLCARAQVIFVRQIFMVPALVDEIKDYCVSSTPVAVELLAGKQVAVAKLGSVPGRGVRGWLAKVVREGEVRKGDEAKKVKGGRRR